MLLKVISEEHKQSRGIAKVDWPSDSHKTAGLDENAKQAVILTTP